MGLASQQESLRFAPEMPVCSDKLPYLFNLKLTNVLCGGKQQQQRLLLLVAFFARVLHGTEVSTGLFPQIYLCVAYESAALAGSLSVWRAHKINELIRSASQATCQQEQPCAADDRALVTGTGRHNQQQRRTMVMRKRRGGVGGGCEKKERRPCRL